MDPQDRLFGEIAVRLRLLSREQVAACIHAQQSAGSKRRIGELALELGFVSQAQVDIVLDNQARVLERRRDARAGNRPSVAAEVMESQPPKLRDRRVDSTQRIHADVQPTSQPAPPPSYRPSRTSTPIESSDTQPRLSQEDLAQPEGLGLAETRPGGDDEASKEAARTAQALIDAEPYEFGQRPKGPAPMGTLVGGIGLPERQRNLATAGTIVQPFAAVATRAPVATGWRNTTVPPRIPAPDVSSADTLSDARASKPARAPRKPVPSTSESAYLDRVLEVAVDADASDLHVHSDAVLLARIDGRLLPLSDEPPLAAAVAEKVIAEIMTEAQWQTLNDTGDMRFSYFVRGVGRFRAHAFRQERGIDITFRMVSDRAATLEDLGLPARLTKLFDGPRGLCLCTGPLGAGKSATQAALLATLASRDSWHAISIEQPIEILQRAQGALIMQREVPTHVASLAEGVHLALRESPHAIAISDLSDAETINAALSAAEGGCAVFASLAADSVGSALARLLGAFSGDAQVLARARLAEALQVVLHQRLLPQAIGRGRVPALEVLVANPQVSQLIREDKLEQIPATIAGSKALGMMTLDDSLDELLRTGAITKQQAQLHADKKERFQAG